LDIAILVVLFILDEIITIHVLEPLDTSNVKYNVVKIQLDSKRLK